MKDSINSALYKEIAAEMSISEKVVQDVILNGQSRCTMEIMEGNTFDGVKWPYLGTFKAKHKSVQIINHIKGLTPIQKELFIASLKAGKLRHLAKGMDKKKKKDGCIVYETGEE